MQPHLTACLSRSVRFLREGHGWSQPDLAERAGISCRSISKIENTPMRANARVRTDMVDRIAGAAGVSSGLLCLTPEVLSLVGEAEIIPPGRRKERLEGHDLPEDLSLRSRDCIVIAQGGCPNRLFNSKAT